jgi:hypothetical protein
VTDKKETETNPIALARDAIVLVSLLGAALTFRALGADGEIVGMLVGGALGYLRPSGKALPSAAPIILGAIGAGVGWVYA